jgi:hypothetical protein
MNRYSRFLIFCACLAASCNHYYYGPNTANIPLLKEKNEGKINFNYFGTDEASGIELQGAYAIGKNTAFMVNFVNASDGFNIFRWGNGDHSVTGSGTYGEIGIGYFSRLQQTNWVVETYGGIGSGGISNWHDHRERSKVNFTKFFVQPSVGYAGENFEIGFSVRIAYVNLKVRTSSVTESGNPGDFHDIQYIRNNRSGFLMEPGFLIRFGGSGLKFMLNYTLSANLNRHWKQQESSIALGVSIPFRITKER